MPACRFTVTGVVQGVFFRAETQRKARELGVTGWVRNCEDGSVEVHAEGLKASITALEEWCRKGPERAKVEDVRPEQTSLLEYKTFEIIA